MATLEEKSQDEYYHEVLGVIERALKSQDFPVTGFGFTSREYYELLERIRRSIHERMLFEEMPPCMVTCDDTNNTTDKLLEGQATVDIHLKPWKRPDVFHWSIPLELMRSG